MTTVFVYDAGGTLIAEYATNTAGSESGTSYVTLDRLGSTRLVTVGVIAKGGQAAKARYDYLPFGAEISSSYGSRSQVAGYAPNEVIRQKYTGYERDTESGLDFAEARYYYNTQGRFISADSVGGTATNPQSLNRYAYTGNNPVNNVDPSGHVFFGAQFNSSQSYGDEASPGYPDYAEAGMSQEMLEKYASMKDINNQDRAARVAKAGAGLFELGNADAQSNATASAHASGGAEQAQGSIPEPGIEVTLAYYVKDKELVAHQEDKKFIINNVTSGVGECMNNGSCSRREDKGPIPPGDYYINSKEVAEASIIRAVARLMTKQGDWGSFRVPIHPYPWTDTYGRKGFFLHGGIKAGSKGCIDVGGGFGGDNTTGRLLRWIRSDSDGRVPLTVMP